VRVLDLSLTDVTAAWGAITGSVWLFDRLRDRPRLELLSYNQIRGHDREIVMTVVNKGRRPAVVMNAGLAIGVHLVSVGRFRRRRPHITQERGQPEPGVLPVTLAPWDSLRWSFKYNSRESLPPFIPFVQDDDGRYTWASKRVPKPSRAAARVARVFESARPP